MGLPGTTRTKRILAAVAATAVVAAGTAAVVVSTQSSGLPSTQGSLDGHLYRLYRPSDAPITGRQPLVLVLHPNPSSAARMEALTVMDAEASTRAFVVVYPNGHPDAAVPGEFLWDAKQGSADLQFISDLIRQLVTTQNIDPARVFVTGNSGGAIMSYSIACYLTDQIKAIAPVSGTMFPGAPRTTLPCTPSRPISVLEVHGTADTTILYGGSASPYYPSSPELHGWWAATEGCGPDRTQVIGNVTQFSAACPTAGLSVRLDEVAGGTHLWVAEESRFAPSLPNPASLPATIGNFFILGR